MSISDFFFSLGCTTPFDFISLCVGAVSILLAIFSIRYAFKCNNDSKKLNKQTSDMLFDMQYMISFNLRATCELQQRMHKKDLSNYKSQLRIPKEDLPFDTSSFRKVRRDRIEVHKLSTFNMDNSDKIMELFSELPIERSELNKLKEFLTSGCIDARVGFVSSVKIINATRIDIIVSQLIKYGLLVGIYYYT